MDPVTRVCESCGGSRYSNEALSYLYKGKNIVEILSMNVEEAIGFFSKNRKISNKLRALETVGLSYLSLGQPASTLSGGERQRLKLAKCLDKKGNIYVLDEPTTGLHPSDIQKLMQLFERLVDKGNTVIVIEHNLDVMKMADYIIDIGPDGGRFGGKIVFYGTPGEMVDGSDTITARCLRYSLENRKLTEEELAELTKAVKCDDESVTTKEDKDEEEEGMKLSEIGHAECDTEFKIFIDEKYKKGLEGLNGFSHLQIIWWFNGCDNEKDRSILTVEKPYHKGPQTMGIFATRSPERPNPIAVSVCGIKEIDYEKGVIKLDYFDAFTGTPILDIKP